MLKRILAAAAIAAMAGGAAAQDVPSGAGLTPGAPLTKDPVTGDPIRAGETDGQITGQIRGEADMEWRPALVPGLVGGDMRDADYPSAPSEAGLTPGAPLGGDSNDNKAVAGS